jgi:hypothetical protein
MRRWAWGQSLGRRWDWGEDGPGDDVVTGRGIWNVGQAGKNCIWGSQGEARF